MAAGSRKFTGVLKAAESAFKRLFEKGKYRPEDLSEEKAYQDLISATNDAFIPTLKDNEIPEEMAESLKKDIFLFSGLKTHAQLFEASRLLTDENGKKRPFHSFSEDVSKLNETYNQTYLESEWQFAGSSAQSAGRWAGILASGDRYLLQYRTAGDDKVRPSHQALADITLPPDDPFWDYYATPNGWRCRCRETQVRRGKYEVSDSAEAMKAGEAATTQIGKNGKNKLAIFRFNPGKQKVIFPPEHPYSKVAAAKQAKKAIKQIDPNG